MRSAEIGTYVEIEEEPGGLIRITAGHDTIKINKRQASELVQILNDWSEP